jgi:dolichol-phosphate mannosyltransferase
MQNKVSIIVPVYNESTNVLPVTEALHRAMSKTGYKYEIIFIDDGSLDNTEEIVHNLSIQDNSVFYISFSRNFGHQNALKAGIDLAKGDCIISLDGDMQHPPDMLPLMLEKWKQGYDIVYTRRQADKKHTRFKRTTSNLFYRFMKYLSGLDMEHGEADFRLLSRRVADVLLTLNEQDIFIRGVIKWMGFRRCAIDYIQGERFSGTSKYTVKKMTNLAIQGITSFSVKPLYISIILGVGFSVLSLAYIPYVIWCVYSGRAITGWASTIIIIMFFGGMQMIVLGIIGIYIGKIFIQSKQRPGYIIKDTNLNTFKENNDIKR